MKISKLVSKIQLADIGRSAKVNDLRQSVGCRGITAGEPDFDTPDI
jgi:hypothetical protein